MSRLTVSNGRSNRGAKAEQAVQEFLTEWSRHPNREFARLTDAKAAGRTIKAAPADFEFYCLDTFGNAHFGLIEVKETAHNYRLDRDKVSQLPRLRKRANCGGVCLVLVHHSVTGVWRVLTSSYLANNGDKGSWNLTEVPGYPSPKEALAAFSKLRKVGEFA